VATIFETIDDTQDTRVSTQSSGREGSEGEEEVEKFGVPEFSTQCAAPSGKVSPCVHTVRGDGGRVERPVPLESVSVHVEPKVQNRWEGVGKLQNAKRCYDARYVTELGDSTCDDECDRPIDESGYDPNVLAGLASQTREVEKILQDVDVDDFDTNITVQTSSDDSGAKGNHVGNGLPGEGRKTLVGRVDRVLPLECVDKDTKEHVEEEDKRLSNDHGLPEIPGTTHLSHEFDEEHGTTITVNDLHHTDDLVGEWDVNKGRSRNRSK